MARRPPHLSVDNSADSRGRSLSPTHQVLASSKPYFDTNPYGGRGIRCEIGLTMGDKVCGALIIIYCDLNNHAGGRDAIGVYLDPGRWGFGKSIEPDSPRSIGTLFASCSETNIVTISVTVEAFIALSCIGINVAPGKS